MKNLTIILSLLFLSNMLFAQNSVSTIGQSSDKKNETGYRSTWVGGGFNSYYTGNVVGDEFYIAGSEFDQIEIGNTITKVKFYHVLGTVSLGSGDVTFTNTQYTIKIYENPVLGGPYTGFGFYNTAIGSPVYTQTVTLGAGQSDTMYELVLNTPYTVTENDFFVAVCFDNGLGAMRLGEADASSEGKYYMYYDGSAYGAGTVIGKPNFGTFSLPVYYPLGISLYVDNGNPYVEQSDLTIKYLNVYPSPTLYITQKTINENEDLVIYPVIKNNGLDMTSNTATITATIGGESLLGETVIDLTGFYELPAGYYSTIFPAGSLTVTATELDNLNMTGIFDICFTVTYSGTDPISSNNTECITVTRGVISPTNCDLEALLTVSHEDLSPIPNAITIASTEDMTIYPAVKNNGPDGANNTAEITVTLQGFAVDNQSQNLSGLLNGETIALSADGTVLTAAQMDLIGASFDICLEVVYAGTDPNAGNNTFCVAVTRQTVLVNENTTKSISVFPNPASEILNVENAENANITIMNMIGEIVCKVENASSNQTINISNLANGTYFVKVNAEVFKFNVVK